MRAAISSNRIHSRMAPKNMAEVFYYSGQYEEWYFACPFHSPRQVGSESVAAAVKQRNQSDSCSFTCRKCPLAWTGRTY